MGDKALIPRDRKLELKPQHEARMKQYKIKKKKSFLTIYYLCVGYKKK